jgi:hypothetical protein
MADSLGESVGATVGFRVRGETRIGARTRVEVVTEGVLTRMLHEDAALEGVGLVIFDEFHERSLNADLGLALSLETQAVLRPELRTARHVRHARRRRGRGPARRRAGDRQRGQNVSDRDPVRASTQRAVDRCGGNGRDPPRARRGRRQRARLPSGGGRDPARTMRC